MSEADDYDLLIVGASTRAAAFSALRAGLRPRCADLFADADLQARCPVVRVPSGGYPALFAELASRPSNVPWMYTGGVENRRRLVAMLAERRPLWGNNRDVLARCRNPWFVAALLREAGLPCPAVRSVREGPPPSGRWLVKPLRGAGGSGIAFAGATAPRRPSYLQEYIDGEPYSAVFLAAEVTRLLGVTRQLVGKSWLHTSGFHYCGNIGPIESPAGSQLEQLGQTLALGCGLRGWFGVDFVLQSGTPWPVEINPRYTASVELHEYGAASRPLVAKGVLYARRAMRFPEDGPWLDSLSTPVEQMPDFADIPGPEQHIPAGFPILTLFARGSTDAACTQALQQIAGTLDPMLFG